MSPDWSDPAYVAAKRAKAAAYAEFGAAAAANPHMAGTPGWFEYFAASVQPLRAAFAAADERFRAETARVIQESEGA